MIEILKTGHIVATDASGHLLNECSESKIGEEWLPAIESLREVYSVNLGGNLHSIYLRGSVPAGRARVGVSDLDTFAVVRQLPSEKELGWIDPYRAKFHKHFPFCPYVEIRLLPLEPLKNVLGYQSWRFTLKTLSLCIQGDDLASELPNFRPHRSLGFFLFGNVYEVLSTAATKLRQTGDEKQIAKVCSWTMKKILRTGFSLVMEREKCFTRDLYPSYSLFSKHYPERETEMRQALEWAVNPSSDKQAIQKYLESFGSWLAAESGKPS